jgi:23S rRNA pseudouridine1911/1915/1917 synthase
MPQTVLDWLTKRYPTAKKQNLRRMVQAGRVMVNGRPARIPAQALEESDKVSVDERPAAKAVLPARRPSGFAVVFEDDDLIVVDKPAGLLTSTNPREKRPTLLAKVRDYVSAGSPNARVGLIHRLDRDASGLLIFSKTDAAYQSLKTQFFKHLVERVYAAVVHGVPTPKKGRIESRLLERADGGVYSTKQHAKGDIAITDYEVVRSEKKMSLVRVTLETGRKHQIRVHLSERNNPIVGDPVYGKEGEGAGVARMMLAAMKLSIDHPRTGERMTWVGVIPKEFPIKPAEV